jgi:glycine betaine/proline transport system substrate-binding protein
MLAVLAVVAIVATACGNGGDTAGGDAGTGGGTIRIGLIPWDEAIAVTNLWQAILEERGYTVEVTQLEVGGLYSGLANGDIDLFFDGWLPATHADYWAQFGQDIDDLKVWYDQAPLTWVVPAYVDDVNSIADLQGKADMFDGRIVGIEAGSGLMRISREEVMPTYGLEDEYTLVESSTPAMLAELDKAYSAQEPIVVTLWEPHWAYGKYDLKNLEDPEGALGQPDEIHVLARKGFREDFPEVAGWLQNFELDGATLADLEVAILVDGPEGKELESAKAWLEENRSVVEAWLS